MGSNGPSAFSPCLRSANLKGTAFDDAFFVPIRDHLRSPPPPRIKSPSLQNFFDIKFVSGTVPVEFSNEHCAFCLRNDRVDDSLLELRCRRLGCVHVVHADCMAMESSQALLLRTHSAQYVHAHAPMSITPTPPPYSYESCGSTSTLSLCTDSFAAERCLQIDSSLSRSTFCMSSAMCNKPRFGQRCPRAASLTREAVSST